MIFKNNKTYDVLKYITLRVLPSMLTFLGVILVQLKYEHTEEIMIICSAFIAMLGQILGLSNDKYNEMIEYDDAGDEEDE